MKQRFIFLSVCLFIITLSACWHTTNNNSRLNLDFEEVEDGMPKGWSVAHTQPDYTVSLDSVNVKSGKYAIAIEFTGTSADYQGIGFDLPSNYDGEKITLSGYIKTENVSDGHAELMMLLEPDIAFGESQDGVTGTTDWKLYELTLNLYPEQTKQITVYGFLVGKGKMWMDDLKVTIDGKDISQLKPYKAKTFLAENDKEFDSESNIVFPELTKQKIEDLELLGRIWGFMKYHHPAIAKGNYNWDYELFRMLPGYLKADNHEKRDRILLQWINKYGSIPKCKNCQATADTAFLKPDLSWIDHSKVCLQLNNKLHEIYLNRHQGNHYYIRMSPETDNPIFSNERAYETMESPDAGFRLLTLYRYWNMIHYFYPYRYLTDKDWNTILKEYIPCLIEAKDRLAYEAAVALLIGEICDTHANLGNFVQLRRPLKSYNQPLISIQFVENELVVLACYDNNAQLKKGDVITHINGKLVNAIVDSVKKYYPASNEAARLWKISFDILYSKEASTQIGYYSSDQLEQKELSLWNYNYGKVDIPEYSYKFIDKDIGYITLQTIAKEDIPVIKKEFKNTKGIIIDIRNNHVSYDVRFLLGSYFVSKDTPFVKLTKGNRDNPGEFTFFMPTNYILSKSEDPYQGKLVVIVNEKTISHAEFTAMAFRAGDHTTIIGSQTAGADGNVSEFYLPGGLGTGISGIGVYYPDGRETQRIGIVPDIEVKPTIKGIREGRDELLEKAIEIIKNEK